MKNRGQDRVRRHLVEFHAWTRFLLLSSPLFVPSVSELMSSRWSERRRGGRLRFIEQQRDTRSANVFSRAPSIKGIFMQRAKVIRSLGMHIARASHGLPLLLSLSLSRGSRERENGLEPVLKGPARKVREVRPSVFFRSIPRHRHTCPNRRAVSVMQRVMESSCMWGTHKRRAETRSRADTRRSCNRGDAS